MGLHEGSIPRILAPSGTRGGTIDHDLPTFLGLGPAALLAVTLLAAPAVADVFNGDGDANTIVATNGDDTIRGNGGNDVITARKGDDTVRGGSGTDKVDAGQGADTVWGGPGDDVLDVGTADAHEDAVYGDAGNDHLFLRSTDDARGGLGDDLIEAVYGAKGMRIDCGAGRDKVIFNQESPKVATTGCERIKVISAG